MAIGDGVQTGEGADLTSGQKAMKYALFGLNLLLLIFGIVLIVLGAKAAKDLASELSNNTLPDGIIVLGVFILVLSLFGFFSAWKEWRPGLGIFAFFVLLLAIILIAVAIAVYVEKGNAGYYIAQGWNGGGTNVQVAIMNEVPCCGLLAPSEFTSHCAAGNMLATDGSTVKVPPPCCVDNYNQTAFPNATFLPNPTAAPCSPILVDEFNKYYQQAGGAGIAFAVLMLVGLVFVWMLMKGIRLKNLNLEVLKNRQRNEAERAERRKGIQLPDNVL